MKTVISFILSLVFLCSLTGCGTEQPEPTQTIPATVATTPSLPDPTDPTEAAELIQYDFPLVAVSAALMDEHFLRNDGTCLLRYTYQDLVLTMDDPQIANAIAMDFLNCVDPAGKEVSKALQDAKEAYQDADNWTPWGFQRIYNPMRLDNTVLSMYGKQTLSNEISSAVDISVTYSLLTGQRLSLNQILLPDYSADDLMQAILDALGSMAAEGTLYSDYAYVISEMFSRNTPIENWYLSSKGLCFYFAPYEIAPHSAGTVVAEVPYSALVGILRDAYFPEEAVDFYGVMAFADFDEADISQFTDFAELILDPMGKEYVFYVSGAATNFRLEIGTWQSDGCFIPEATLLAAATLCQTSAIVLQISDATLQNLRISFDCGGDTVYIPASVLNS